ncbi:putative esterase azaC [Lachnellula suecica]|uniref:Putative esterase azaC n=1 Tax=Lachnellula suecica TaxID=602035 RepID=A0A8T9BZQ3_9HELO|nr:putative esterase azaC [Lachnellula suecica]
MPLPRIACFHGGGSTAPIFAVQCSRLQKQLDADFQLVFFEAPFERSAGPGVLPFFDEKTYGPYKTWFLSTDEARQDGSSEEGGEDGVERVLSLMRAQGEGGNGPLMAGEGQVEKISIPTFHLHGLRDKQLEPGRQQMKTYYDAKTTKLMEIDYHHAMPWNKEDLEGFAGFLREAYASVTTKNET